MITKYGYNTKSFCDVWNTVDDFLEDYQDSGLSKYDEDGRPVGNTLDDDTIGTVYYLLYGRYGNSPIANRDENQFKYKLMSIIFMYGPSWKKNLDIQAAIRELSFDDISKGNISISNSVMNDGNEGTTDSFVFLDKINSQSGHVTKRGALESYTNLTYSLADDVTEAFIARFAECFAIITTPSRTFYYDVPVEEDE